MAKVSLTLTWDDAEALTLDGDKLTQAEMFDYLLDHLSETFDGAEIEITEGGTR